MDIYRTYDSFTETARCSYEILDSFYRFEMGSEGTFQISNGTKSGGFGRYGKLFKGIEIKYGNNKPKPFTNLLGFLIFDDFKKYRTVKLRIKDMTIT